MLQPGKAVLNKQPKRLQKVKTQKQQDDDVTSEESDAELLVCVAIISLLMS